MSVLRRALLTLGVLASLTLHTTPAKAQQVPGPIKLVPQSPDAALRLEGKFVQKPDLCAARQPQNLHAAYPGTLEIGRRGDGLLYIVTELDFGRYLKGIAEVPRDWPLEALKAQIVAARTYAISHMNPSTPIARELNYNLCATDSCQVYRGLAVENGAWGSAWAAAVDETAGRILSYRGEPASTFYFSTSNGQTYSNSEGFGGTPLPYLKPVTEEDDHQSPYSNWSVRMPLVDLAEALKLAGRWSGAPVGEVTRQGDSVHIAGSGQAADLTVDQFRNGLNQQAVCLVPKRYPTPSSTGRPLPQVLPSKWFEIRREGSDAIFIGRGWGHGVGMVQWGLKGKADRGMKYDEMLAFYYAGIKPSKQGEPGRIRIGLAIDLEEITIERRGNVSVEGAELPEGPIVLRGGNALSISRGKAIPPNLKVEKLALAEPPPPGGPVKLAFELSGPANVHFEYRAAEGSTASEGPEPRDRGPQTLTWNSSALPPSNYEVKIVADDGVDSVSTPVIHVPVTSASPAPIPASPSPSPPPVATRSRGRGWLVAGILAAVLLLAAGTVRLRSRRRL